MVLALIGGFIFGLLNRDARDSVLVGLALGFIAGLLVFIGSTFLAITFLMPQFAGLGILSLILFTVSGGIEALFGWVIAFAVNLLLNNTKKKSKRR